MKTKKLATLMATVMLAACSTAAYAGPVFSSSNYNTSNTFTDALDSTTMTVAFDGSSYWTSSGGYRYATNLAQYTAGGNLLGTYVPGLDMRSVFTDASNNVLARQFADNTIYQQTSPGNFSSLLTLNGGYLDAQSAVVKDGSNYVALAGGTVSQWDAAGNYVGAVTLNGMNGSEASYPQGRGMATAGGYWLTYDGNTGMLSAWDHSGNRVDSTMLNGAGNSFDSNFSLSFANNEVWVVDAAHQTWRGYDVGLAAAPVPEPETYAMLLGGLSVMALLARRRKHA